MTGTRNVQATAFDRRFNAAVGFLTRHGISVFGTRVLAVRGRTSGAWRTTPVNLLTLDGERYLVAARGHTQWTRNMRAALGGELRLGRRTEAFTAQEVSGAEKREAMRTYFARWGWEVGRFFDVPIKNASDETLDALAPEVPVFKLTR